MENNDRWPFVSRIKAGTTEAGSCPPKAHPETDKSRRQGTTQTGLETTATHASSLKSCRWPDQSRSIRSRTCKGDRQRIPFVIRHGNVHPVLSSPPRLQSLPWMIRTCGWSALSL